MHKVKNGDKNRVGKSIRSNSTDIQRKMKVKEQDLRTTTSFKCLGTIVLEEGSKTEVLDEGSKTEALLAVTKMRSIWRDKNTSLGSKIKLPHCLVTSIFLYICESWALTTELEKRTQAFEMRCYRRL